MSTTTGSMSKFTVTAPNGDVFSLDPIDAEARQQIDEAKNLQFDDDYFTAVENSDEVNIGLNGAQFGVDESLKFVEDTASAITLGLNSTVASGRITAIGNVPVGPDVSGYQTKLVPDTKTAAASVSVDNNKVTSIEIPSDSSIPSMAVDCTVASGECANFACEISNLSSNDCSVSVTLNGTAGAMRRSASSDGTAGAGKYYQLTCVGNCWTMAEFGPPQT